MKITIEHLQENHEVIYDENTVISLRYNYFNKENKGYRAEIYSYAEKPYGSMWSKNRLDRIECGLHLEKSSDEHFKSSLEAMRWAMNNV